MDNDELLIVIKDLFEKKTDEIKSYVDEKINGQSVLIERLQGDIKVVAEGHETLNRKIDSLDTKVDSLDKKVYLLDKKVDLLEKKVDSLDKKVDSLDKKVDSLDKKVDSLDKKIDDRTNELKAEIKVLENYIIGVDTKLNEHDVILKRVK